MNIFLRKKINLTIAVVSGSLFCVPIALAITYGPVTPVSDGTYKQWVTKTGSNHTAMVKETPCDGTGSYVRTGSKNVRDSYKLNISAVPNGAEIVQIVIAPCASRDSAAVGGYSYLSVFYRFNGVNSYDNGYYALTGIKPVQFAATTFKNLTLMKASGSLLEVGAVLSNTTRGARLSRIETSVIYTTTAPAAPSDLLASADSGSFVSLSWKDNSFDESAFKVERKVGTGSFVQIGTANTDSPWFFDNNLISGITYTYRVRASNVFGDSEYSNESSVVKP